MAERLEEALRSREGQLTDEERRLFEDHTEKLREQFGAHDDDAHEHVAVVHAADEAEIICLKFLSSLHERQTGFPQIVTCFLQKMQMRRYVV